MGKLAISEGKKRVLFTLSEKDIEKVKELYEIDKQQSDKRIYESDTIKKIINEAYNNRIRGIKNEEGRK